MKEDPLHSGFRRHLGFVFLATLSTSLWANSAATLCPKKIAERVQAPAIVIVDATSSGGLIAPRAKERGIIPIHVQSSTVLDPALIHAMQLEHFDEDKRFVFNGDRVALQNQLRAFPIHAVLPGCETGVRLGDSLSEDLGVISNGTALSHARRDKYEMIETCRRAGVPVAKQFLARDRGRSANAAAMPPIPSNPQTQSVYGAESADFRSVLDLGGALGLEAPTWLQEYFPGEHTYTVQMERRDNRLEVTGVTRKHRATGRTSDRWDTRAQFVRFAAYVLEHANVRYADLLEGLPKVGFPVIIKPRDAAAGFGVAKETTNFGALLAMGRLLGKRNPITNEPITEALVMEYLDGKDEFVVDLAMMNGELYVTDVSRYNKIAFNGSPVVYESEDMITVEWASRLGLIDYARQVVNALGIRYGAVHMEIKMTSQGPRLVEVAARLSGGGFPVLVKEATGEDPIDALLDAYVDPESFRARMNRPHRLRSAAIVYLMSPRGGRLVALPFLDEIRKLPSFFRAKMNIDPGDLMEPTTDFLNYPGHIELVNDDPQQLAMDRAYIRELETRRGFYVMEGDPTP